eukprot:SAG11_NODE_11821_length_736_cov_1.588697_1_plen_111_part_00
MGRLLLPDNVLQSCAEAGVSRIAMASRAGVHGGWGEPHAWVQRTVEQRSRPVGHYTVSKVFIEAIGYSYAQQHSMSVVCVRIGNFVSLAAPSAAVPGADLDLRWLAEPRP